MPPESQTEIQYAGLGLRVAATIIDTAALFFCMTVLIGVAGAAGALDLSMAGATDPFDAQAVQAAMPGWLYIATYALIFVYYAILEGLTGASLGKLAVGTRVLMDDGRPPRPAAIVVRNLIRIPELLFWYIPSAVSCMLSPSRKRLGDYAARTVVVRRVAVAQTGPVRRPSPPRTTAPTTAAATLGHVGPQAAAPGLPDALAQLTASASSAHTAHDAFARLSAAELARAAAQPPTEDEEPQYSAEYVAAWYALSEAVYELREASAAATAAADSAGTTLAEALVGQPELAGLLHRLGPYLAPDAGERLSEAYVQVARGEASA